MPAVCIDWISKVMEGSELFFSIQRYVYSGIKDDTDVILKQKWAD